MSFKWEHNKDDNLKIPNPKGKIKWEKLDKDLYRAMVTEKSTALYEIKVVILVMFPFKGHADQVVI
jgi:hypothetical protein